jgi:mannose-6-phosphate isomerase-like protein (cupin superfamily)
MSPTRKAARVSGRGHLNEPAAAAARAALDSVPFEIERTQRGLEAAGGGYQVVHASPGLEIGVYVLWAPEPDRQQPHEDDEVYVVLEGRGVLEVEGRPVPLEPGQAVYVPARAEHGFTAYEQLSVLVIFARRQSVEPSRDRMAAPQ